jgi:hypothetical protein
MRKIYKNLIFKLRRSREVIDDMIADRERLMNMKI